MEPPVSASGMNVEVEPAEGFQSCKREVATMRFNVGPGRAIAEKILPDAPALGPMLRRASTFSHRTERALKDVNGRVGSVNKSQENMSISKTALDGQKVTRTGKQYSAVASRYAAPLASKKQLSASGDGPQSWRSNMTKLPFITGKSAPLHKRRPSADNLSSVQPPMVFAASARDVKPDTLAKKAEVPSSAVGSKRPRVVNRTNMMEKKSEVRARAPRFSSLDKGRCSCSKNGMVRGSVDVSLSSDASLLYSAAHWVSLIKLAEGEKKHEVVIDLFRVAIRLEAEPRKDVLGHLKRYQESCPGDELLKSLVQQCENTQHAVRSTSGDVIDKSICEPQEPKGAAPEAGGDVPPKSTSSIVPAVVVETRGAMKKDVQQKRPHFMGRMLSRSSTFSCVDADSRSQHAKAEYGKKLAKTMEFLATQAVAHCASKTGEVPETSPSEIQNLPPAGAPAIETMCVSTPSSDDQGAPGLSVGSKMLELASRVGSKLTAQPASEDLSGDVLEARSTLVSGLGNGGSEKPVDSLSRVLDGESSAIGSLGVESSPIELVVDLSPRGMAGVLCQSSPCRTQASSLVSFPAVETVSKSPSTSEVDGQRDLEASEEVTTALSALGSPSLISEDLGTPSFKVASSNVEMASKFSRDSAAEPPLSRHSVPVFEERCIRASAVFDGVAEKPVDSLSEWLDGDSSEKGTPEIQSAVSGETVDLSPEGRGAVRLMDVDSVMREVVSHILPDHVATSPSDFKVPEMSGRFSRNGVHSEGNDLHDGGEQSMTEIVENISRSHRHSLSAEAILLSVRGSVEEKVKMFTELAEVRGATSGLAESPDGGSDSKEGREAEAHLDANDLASGATSSADISTASASAVDTSGMPASAMDLFVDPVSAVNRSVEAECGTTISVDGEISIVQDESSKIPLVTPMRKLTKQRSMKGDAGTPFVPATPSADTPSETASARILRSRHRRTSSVGNMSRRGPWDMTVECSPLGSSPSGQSSSTKSKRLSRGSREVTPRVDLPKPSWKSIVEREMKGSKLKEILSAKLPKETSPLSEYVQSQMENQSRDLENGSSVAIEKDPTSTCSPPKRVTRLTKSCSKNKAALKEAQQDGGADPRTARKGDRENGADTPGCPTPGSAVRRSARIHRKVQSLFKDEFAHL